MIIYFIIFMIPMMFAISMQGSYGKAQIIPAVWFLLGIVITLFVGYRYEVGGDWFNYLNHFNSMQYFTPLDILKRSDPGYYIINWYMKDWGFQIISVNVISTIIFMTGLMIFAKNQPNPWLALAVAFPYLVVVVMMGYTRQGVALGLVFWSLIALVEKRFIKFLVIVSLAATFHKTAVIMIGLGVFLQGSGKLIRSLSVVLVGIGIWNAFLAEYQDELWKNYVEVQMESQGAYIRVIMNLIPALIFLAYRKIWKRQFSDYMFWVMVALGSVASVFVVGFASTAVDRIALYFTPIQVVVYSRLPYLLRDTIAPQITTLMILIYYLAVLYVWLNHATHAQYWLPYQNALFEGVF